MPHRAVCALCARPLTAHAHYIVRIDVFAEPSMPPITGEELADTDYRQTLEDLIEQMKHLSEDDLQDQVHRRFEYKLCPACQRRFLANPLGKPRRRAPGKN